MLAQTWYQKAVFNDCDQAPQALRDHFEGTNALYPENQVFEDLISENSSSSEDNTGDSSETFKPQIFEKNHDWNQNSQKTDFDISLKATSNDSAANQSSDTKTGEKTMQDHEREREDRVYWREEGDDHDDFTDHDSFSLGNDLNLESTASNKSSSSSFESSTTYDYGRSYDEELYDNKKFRVIEPDESIDPFDALDALIGLDGVKAQVRRAREFINFEKLRQDKDLPSQKQSNHFIFSGNPGTGKNEVARLLGHILRDAGVLESGHVVEVDAGDLVAGWVGHTALKTKSAIKKAKGGVLFIDEAYGIDHGYAWGFGDEVLSTLLKAMEDQRDEFVIVMAGYQDQMKSLINSNPGLRSRFRHHIYFEDYSADELLGIFEIFAKEQLYKLTIETRTALLKLFRVALKQEDKKLGNGRFVRNVFEKVIENMAIRVVRKDKPTKRDLRQIMFTDIPSFEDVTGQSTPFKQRVGEIVDF